MTNSVTRVLLVEDDLDEARTLERSLVEAGGGHFDVARAAGLDEAVAALAARPFDAVLLDVSVGDGAGASAVRRVAAAAPAVPILALTAHSDENTALETQAYGADDYLVKGRSGGSEIIRAVRYAVGRRRVEEALRLSESRMRRLYESGVIGIVYSSQAGTITEANDAFLAMVGYSRDDLAAGRLCWRAMTPPQYLPMEDRFMAEAGPGRPILPYEKEYVRKDGSRVPVLIGPTKLDPPDEGFICFVLDLTQRKRFENALQELNQTLDARVRERTAVAEERAAQLRVMSLELTQAEQRERRRLAALLHDNLQQLLAAARMYAGMARSQAEGDAREAIMEAERLITDAIAQSRSLTLELSPPISTKPALSLRSNGSAAGPARSTAWRLPSLPTRGLTLPPSLCECSSFRP